MPNWAMVSLPHGAASARKDIQKQIPLFQGYQEIVLFFDNDEPGRKACEEVANVLPPGKVKIARMEAYKDASEALMASDGEAIRKAIWDAKPYRPDGIIDGKTLLDLVTTPQKPFDHEYPFKGLNEKLHGIRYGELTTFTAGSGSGKTSVMRHIAVDLLNKGESVGILELEASNRRTALGLMLYISQNMKKRNSTPPLAELLPIGIFICLTGLEVLIQMLSTTGLNISLRGWTVRSLF
jgi:twinkle protein